MRVLCASLILTLTGGTALAEGDDGMGHGHHDCPDDAVVQPLLSVADIDGDGTVEGDDVDMVSDQKDSGEYEAIMDLDADGDVDGDDVQIAAHDIGSASTALDQQIAAVFHATKRYKNIDNAIADGFRPFTPTLEGHGIHYARLPFLVTADGLDPSYPNVLDDNVDITVPEGLNYDPEGNLVAVFYYHGVDVYDWVFADDATRSALVADAMSLSLDPTNHPDAFASDHEMWHQHFGACFPGLNYQTMSFDPSLVPGFLQPLTDVECYQEAAAQQGTTDPDVGWLPAFNMMHLWLYELNRCGKFAGTLEGLADSYPEEPHLYTYDEWCAKQFGEDSPFCAH